jgi:hypothetical protein
MPVVHDFVADVDRRSIFLQRPLDDFDGAHNPGAESARLGKDNLHFLSLVSRLSAARKARSSAPNQTHRNRFGPGTIPNAALSTKMSRRAARVFGGDAIIAARTELRGWGPRACNRLGRGWGQCQRRSAHRARAIGSGAGGDNVSAAVHKLEI